MFKKVILTSILALAFSGTANAKQIMVCYDSSPSFPTNKIDCYIKEKNIETNLTKLYAQGWRLIDTIIPYYRYYSSSGAINENKVIHYLEK